MLHDGHLPPHDHTFVRPRSRDSSTSKSVKQVPPYNIVNFLRRRGFWSFLRGPSQKARSHPRKKEVARKIFGRLRSPLFETADTAMAAPWRVSRQAGGFFSSARMGTRLDAYLAHHNEAQKSAPYRYGPLCGAPEGFDTTFSRLSLSANTKH
jgi:hypothetical protein